ncbi:hypothetical protein EDC01DRAFT_750901 [Geopyxis carbonaria]|nr:hypothetical protein EDC01DRAFT_750901 [Geopyxis carbonaria]
MRGLRTLRPPQLSPPPKPRHHARLIRAGCRTSPFTRGLFTMEVCASPTPPPNHEFFTCTSHRWLASPDLHLSQRFRPFLISGLQRVAATAAGANHCTHMVKAFEDERGKTFRLTLDTGVSLLAYIPHYTAGSEFHTTSSEVATMAFARDVLGIPVPPVLAWSADTWNTDVMSQYIIMREPAGTPLHTAWASLAPFARAELSQDLVEIERRLLSVSFSHIGSLYFAKDDIERAVPAAASGPGVTAADIDDVARRWTVGPSAARAWWDGRRATLDTNRGPWPSALKYLTSVTRRELAWLASAAPSLESAVPPAAPPAWQRTSQLFERLRLALPNLIPDSPSGAPSTVSTLWHNALLPANLYATPSGQITGVLNWSHPLLPLFLTARPNPPLVPTHDPAATTRAHPVLKRLRALHAVAQIQPTPALSGALHKPLSTELVGADGVSYEGTGANVVPLRERLIWLERFWPRTGAEKPCPYRFSQTEIEWHEREKKGWNEVGDWEAEVRGVVDSEGGVEVEKWTEGVRLVGERLGVQDREKVEVEVEGAGEEVEEEGEEGTEGEGEEKVEKKNEEEGEETERRVLAAVKSAVESRVEERRRLLQELKEEGLYGV